MARTTLIVQELNDPKEFAAILALAVKRALQDPTQGARLAEQACELAHSVGAIRLADEPADN
jgi:ribosomal protein S18 acetylase RimI-like enzyme